MAKKTSSITTHTDISEVVANCDHLSQPSVESRIFTIRGIQVIIDKDLAELYGVTTKRLNEQVRRNIRRFPVSFRFQLTTDETAEVVANCDHLSTCGSTVFRERQTVTSRLSFSSLYCGSRSKNSQGTLKKG